MRKMIKSIILIIIFILICLCIFTFAITRKNKNTNSIKRDPYNAGNKVLSYAKKKVGLDAIKNNETVLILRLISDSWGHSDTLLIFNKNHQYKLIFISKDKETPENLLEFCDKKLQNNKIPYGKQKLSISNDTLGEMINVEEYSIEEAYELGIDEGTISYGSVCGSGSDRFLVLIKTEGDSKKRQVYDERVNEVCNNMKSFYANLVKEIVLSSEKNKSVKNNSKK